jgi:hypothetical protein
MHMTKDRRQPVRQQRNERVVLQFVSSIHDRLPAGTVVRCSTTDISPQGLRIQLDRQLPEGFLLELCVDLADHPSSFFLAGEVRWCRAVAKTKRSLIGVELKEEQCGDLKLWQNALGS